MTQLFAYTGRDNLEAMSYAINYNNSIYSWLSENIKIEDSILDFGSGHGEFFNRFQDEDANIFGVEPDLSMHQYYKNNKIYESIERVDKSFSLIYSVNVLEHIQDDESIVKILKNYLKDEKSIIKIFVPARQELFSSMDRKVGHFRRYSKSQLENLLVDNGYKVITCRYFDSLGYFATLVYKLFNKSGDINKHGIKIFDKYIFPLNFITDKIFCKFIGKNIMLEASKK